MCSEFGRQVYRLWSSEYSQIMIEPYDFRNSTMISCVPTSAQSGTFISFLVPCFMMRDVHRSKTNPSLRLEDRHGVISDPESSLIFPQF